MQLTATDDVVASHRRHLFPWVKPYYEDPVVLAGGSGVWVRDADGRAYLDFFSGILTTSIGHGHPRVVAAVEDQVRRLGHTSTLYVTQPQVTMAERLARLSPGNLSRTAFTNSGTEAVETALMAACLYTGRTEIVALRYAYSGRSMLATNVGGHAAWRPLTTQIAGIQHARAPYVYRSPLGPDASEEEHTDFFIEDLVDVIESTTGGRPAALIAETILGAGGFIVPPRGYLARAAEVIRSYGGVFISDEVQTGFGRTGGAWFGIEHEGVEPDIMIMAKGIANGFPVGATIARPEIAEAWASSSISTFGGNPVCMAAALETLTVMEEEDVPTLAAERGARVRSGLEALARAAEVIRSYGGVFISDEVQTGFGRTGGAWFGIEHEGVEPDIMVMAKGIANGFPVGATIARSEIAEAWTSSSISTFGGNPVCMAAALATLAVMEEEDVPARAAERGARVRSGLEALAREHDWIGDVRGKGLMQAMEIVTDPGTRDPDPARTTAIHEAAKAEGLLVGVGGRHGHVIRVGPSLLVTDDEVDEAMARLARACRAAADR